MSRPRAEVFLEQLLEAGANCIGEVAIERGDGERFVLTHRDDRGRDDLDENNEPFAALELARYDDTGRYRPLKTAPNLRHGWKLRLLGWPALRLALDTFYPGRLDAWSAWQDHELLPTPVRETLNRQTGMYRIAATISDDALNELIGNFCRSDGGCLRTIVWKRNREGEVPSTVLPPAKYDPRHDQTGRGENAVPLICQEACNLLVAAARAAVKRAPAAASE